jgi:prevent-host-death family protein
VDQIPQKELRNNVGDILRRVERGERFVITVSGRPVAELGPTAKRRWVGGDDLSRIWRTPPPDVAADLGRFPTAIADPYAR